MPSASPVSSARSSKGRSASQTGLRFEHPVAPVDVPDDHVEIHPWLRPTATVDGVARERDGPQATDDAQERRVLSDEEQEVRGVERIRRETQMEKELPPMLLSGKRRMSESTASTAAAIPANRARLHSEHGERLSDEQENAPLRSDQEEEITQIAASSRPAFLRPAGLPVDRTNVSRRENLGLHRPDAPNAMAVRAARSTVALPLLELRSGMELDDLSDIEEIPQGVDEEAEFDDGEDQMDDEDDQFDDEDDQMDDDDDQPEDEDDRSGEEEDDFEYALEAGVQVPDFESREGRPQAFASVDMIGPRRSFKGAKNMETVKDCNFLGVRSDKICSGSDDGNFFVWDKDSGRLEGIWEGDGHVVNGESLWEAKRKNRRAGPGI